jgi:hypothetical protein
MLVCLSTLLCVRCCIPCRSAAGFFQQKKLRNLSAHLFLFVSATHGQLLTLSLGPGTTCCLDHDLCLEWESTHSELGTT